MKVAFHGRAIQEAHHACLAALCSRWIIVLETIAERRGQAKLSWRYDR